MADTIRRAKRDFFYSYNMIFDQPISSQAKLVYIYLCRCADQDGQSFPGMRTIAKKCDVALRSAQRAMRVLEECGLVTREEQHTTNAHGGVQQLSNLYTIYDEPTTPNCTFVTPPPKEPAKTKASNEGGVPHRHPPLSHRHPPPVTQTPPPCQCDTLSTTQLSTTQLSKSPSVCPSDSQTETDRRTDKKTASSKTDTVQYIEYEKTIKKNIEYDSLVVSENKELVNNFIAIIVDVLVTKSDTVHINGVAKPRELVKSTFMKLNYGDMETALHKYEHVNNRIKRTKEYITTLLYNQKLEGEAHLTNLVNSYRSKRE